MATPTSEASLEEIANSLTDADSVPPKLRCAACNKIAFNAFKLPCCQQNVCCYCKEAAADTCPVCSHTPLDPDDAKPAKSLRLTVTQYLKNVKKKRDKAAAAATAAAGSTTPTAGNTEAIPAAGVGATLEASESLNANVDGGETPLATVQTVEYNPAQEVEASAERVAEEKAELQELDATATLTQSKKVPPGEEGEDTKNPQNAQQNDQHPDEEEDDEDAESDTSDIEIVTGDEDKTAINPWGEPEEEYYDQDQQWQEGADQDQIGGQGFGYQGDQGDMSNMFPGMNPHDMMQQMMMQMNAINPNWSNSMGMNNMDMMNNPMFMMAAMQNSMQGMGGMGSNMMFNNMNDMSGMMGGMGYNGNFGGGNGWNGMNNDAGGDFGAASGYYPDGGYNQSSHQGNYAAPHMSSHHNHQNQRFSKSNSYNQQQGPFRGSGRGYGRGYHNNQGYHGRNHSQNHAGVSDGPPPNAPTGPKAQREPVDTPQQQQGQDRTSPKDDSDRRRHASTEAGAVRDTTNDNQQEVSTNTRGTPFERPHSQSGELQQAESERNGANDYFDQTNGTPDEAYSDQRSHRGGHRGRGHEVRGGWRGRGGWQNQGSRSAEAQPVSSSTESAGPGVEGAPSGPKAMRDFNARGRGGFHGRGPSQSFSSSRHEDKPDSRPRSRDRSTSRDRSRSRSRRRSRRRRSQSPTTDADHDRRKDHKRRRKYEEDYDDQHNEDQEMQDANEEKYRSSRREHERHRSSRSHRETSKDRRKHRRRSRSPEDHDMQEQQAYVNGDGAESKEKERRRDRDKYHERSRDRDRHRDKDRDRERDKKRSSRRDRSASPDSQHRSSHRHEKEDREHEQRDKERDSRRASAASITKATRPDMPDVQKQLEQGFRIHGRSREKERDRLKAEAASAAEVVAPAPADTSTDSSKMQPPTGPRADRSSGAPSKFKLDLANLNTKTPSGPRGSAPSSRRTSQPATPTSAATPKVTTPIDPYEAERLKAQQARIAKEHARRNNPAPAPGLAKKRSFAEVGEEGSAAEKDSWAAEREREREKKRVKGRKMSYKFEDDVGRGEEERESARYR